MLKVLLCDDHRVLTDGIGSVLARAGDIEIVGSAGTVAEVTGIAACTQPDVVLMDYDLPDGDGVAATRTIQSIAPATKVVMLTAYVDEFLMARALAEGCIGFLGKQEAMTRVVDVVRRAAAGETVLPPEVFDGIEARAMDPAGCLGLSRRELDVLALLVEGRSNMDIGDCLGIATNTVRNHVGHVLRKLGVRSRLEAVLEAIRLGLVER